MFLISQLSSRAHPGDIQFKLRVGLAKVAMVAIAIGLFLGVHLTLLVFALANGRTVMTQWCLYFVALLFYHCSEFYMTAKFNPRTLSSDSFLINQSKQYMIAATVSWVEFWVECYFFPYLKGRWLFIGLGLAGVCIGQFFRSGAMWNAGSNFTHTIAYEKRPSHELVTTGFYRVSRHPSYFGWFWWSISTQVLLSNPICVPAYFWASHKFFSERIQEEEEILCKLFPGKYEDFQKRTGVGIPFIS